MIECSDAKRLEKLSKLYNYSGALYPYRKERETHELIFPRLSWLAILLVGACARRRRRSWARGGRSSAKRLTETCSLGHPCYGQLTPVKKGVRWPVSRHHIASLSLELIEVTCFLQLTTDRVLIFDWIAGPCQVNLLTFTGLGCWKLVNPKPGL